LNERAIGHGGLIVSATPVDVEPIAAVMLGIACTATGWVVTVKVAVVAPPGTTTVAGTVATD
jgi:hypothetical protein